MGSAHGTLNCSARSICQSLQGAQAALRAAKKAQACSPQQRTYPAAHVAGGPPSRAAQRLPPGRWAHSAANGSPFWIGLSRRCIYRTAVSPCMRARCCQDASEAAGAYCVRFVRAARVSPKLMLCAKLFAPAVAAIPRNPANCKHRPCSAWRMCMDSVHTYSSPKPTRSGQHHEPTSAGRDRNMVSSEAAMPAWSVSSPGPWPLLRAAPAPTGLDHALPAHSTPSCSTGPRS